MFHLLLHHLSLSETVQNTWNSCPGLIDFVLQSMTCCTHFYNIQPFSLEALNNTWKKLNSGVNWLTMWENAPFLVHFWVHFLLPFLASCFSICYEKQLLSIPSKTHLNKGYHLPEPDLFQPADLSGFARQAGLFATQAADPRAALTHTRLPFAQFLPPLLTVASQCLCTSLDSRWKCVCMDMRVCLCRQKRPQRNRWTHTHTHLSIHTR